MAIRCSNLVESKSENGLLFALQQWLVDVYNYDKEIKLIFYILVRYCDAVFLY